jgi:hypothetical protein
MMPIHARAISDSEPASAIDNATSPTIQTCRRSGRRRRNDGYRQHQGILDQRNHLGGRCPLRRPSNLFIVHHSRRVRDREMLVWRETKVWSHAAHRFCRGRQSDNWKRYFPGGVLRRYAPSVRPRWSGAWSASFRCRLRRYLNDALALWTIPGFGNMTLQPRGKAADRVAKRCRTSGERHEHLAILRAA